MTRKLLVVLCALVLAFVIAGPAYAAKGGHNAPLASTATISVTPSPASVGDTLVVSFTGAVGGFVEFNNPCAHGYISSGFGDASIEFPYVSCAGTWTFDLTSAPVDTGGDVKSYTVLAETTDEVS